MGSVKNYFGALMVTGFVALMGTGQPASAITAELAKKCREMAFKAYPPVATGSKQSNAKGQQDYYRTCVAKNGKMD